MKKLRGAFYAPKTTGEDVMIFTQTEEDARFEVLNREHGGELTLSVPFGEPSGNPNYYDVLGVDDFFQAQTLRFIMIPHRRDRATVANALRWRFGPKTALHFQGFPRECERNRDGRPAGSPATHVWA